MGRRFFLLTQRLQSGATDSRVASLRLNGGERLVRHGRTAIWWQCHNPVIPRLAAYVRPADFQNNTRSKKLKSPQGSRELLIDRPKRGVNRMDRCRCGKSRSLNRIESALGLSVTRQAGRNNPQFLSSLQGILVSSLRKTNVFICRRWDPPRLSKSRRARHHFVRRYAARLLPMPSYQLRYSQTKFSSSQSHPSR